MPFNTRIDGRSPTNKELHIKDSLGKTVAIIVATDKSAHLSIDALHGYEVCKVKETTNE